MCCDSNQASAPAPDPRLVQAQVNSLDTQSSLLNQMMGIEQQYQPLQSQAMNLGLQAQSDAINNSEADRAYALGQRDKLTSTQNKIWDRSNNFDEGARADQLTGLAEADVNSQFDSAAAQRQRDMDRRGVAPNSGQALAAGNTAAMQKALANVSAASGARTQAKSEGLQYDSMANQALQGFPTLGMQNTAAGAGFGASANSIAGSGVAGMISPLSSAGSLASSMGQNATGMYNAQSQFNLGNQQLMNNDPMMGMLGNAMGMYASSDVNQKESIKKLPAGMGLMMIKAMPVSSWQYKGDSHAADGGVQHIGPMAQDVHAAAGDKVAPGGKVIDLISLNGINMAATKDLSDKVDQLTHHIRRITPGGLRRSVHV